MRQYEPIWIQLKEKHQVAISASPTLHRRIIQAVRKEKAKDVGWKYLLAESKKRYELKDQSIGKIIKFHLVELDYIPCLADL